ncbi:MAG: PadR family transcriptional regulator [Clostridia bacterium]
MLIPIYILGLLQRFGPQHGYFIKKIIAEQLSDFTQIKLPTIYYHLEGMQKKGLVVATKEKPDSRPEKTIYEITALGIEFFNNGLNSFLTFEYQPSFPSDSVFYFSEHIDQKAISENLETYCQKLMKSIEHIIIHQTETIKFVPEQMQNMVNIIFSHHLLHYKAELTWAKESITLLKEKEKIK